MLNNPSAVQHTGSPTWLETASKYCLFLELSAVGTLKRTAARQIASFCIHVSSAPDDIAVSLVASIECHLQQVFHQ